MIKNLFDISKFYVTWTTYKWIGTDWERFQRLSWSPCQGIINVPIKSSAKNYSPKNFMVGLRTTSKYRKLCSLKIDIVLQISDEIAALGFKLSVHIRRQLVMVTWHDILWNHSRLVPIEFKNGPSYVKHTIGKNFNKKVT